MGIDQGKLSFWQMLLSMDMGSGDRPFAERYCLHPGVGVRCFAEPLRCMAQRGDQLQHSHARNLCRRPGIGQGCRARGTRKSMEQRSGGGTDQQVQVAQATHGRPRQTRPPTLAPVPRRRMRQDLRKSHSKRGAAPLATMAHGSRQPTSICTRFCARRFPSETQNVRIKCCRPHTEFMGRRR